MATEGNGYASNGDKRLKLTDIDEETLNSGAEGYDGAHITYVCNLLWF